MAFPLFPDKIRLVHIETVILPDLLKALYPDPYGSRHALFFVYKSVCQYVFYLLKYGTQGFLCYLYYM